jgi:hypothetical protein
MGRLHPGAALLLSLGCGSVDLAHTPIVGGTEPVRQAIRAELGSFAEATGRAALPVSRVRVADLGQTLGRYNHVTLSIVLDDGLDQTRVIEVLRHELCHALDAREHLHQQQSRLHERLARGVFSSSFAEDIDSCEGSLCQQREVFAAYCAKGPWVAHAMAQRCEADPADGQKLLQSMAEQIWTETDPLLPTSEGPAWASVVLDPHTEASPRATTQPGTFGLVLSEPGVTYLQFLDVLTGEPAEGEMQLLPTAERPPPGLPLELPDLEIAPGAVGSEQGPYLGTVRLPLFELGEAERRVWYDTERWWLAGEGCAEEPEPFLVGEDVLTLRTEGERLAWGPLGP